MTVSKWPKILWLASAFFAPVIVRGEESEGVRLWGFGKTAYQELLNLVLNPDYGDITDVEEGTDLVLTYGKPPGAQFPQTSLTPRRRASRMMDSDEKVAQMLDQVPDHESVFERKTPEQVQVMLDEYLLGDSDADEVSSETSKYNGSASETSTVDQAFQELLG
jgi:hypothetical protein